MARENYKDFNAFYENFNNRASGSETGLFKSIPAGASNPNLEKAASEAKISKNLQYAKAGVDLFASYMDFVDTRSKERVFDSQKTMIDANMANHESYLMDRLDENMAQLDVFTAAKNVDIRSQAITSSKEVAGIDMGNDINAQRRQTNLQKIGLDLQYAMEKQRAKTALLSTAVQTGVKVAMLASDRRLKENLVEVGKLKNGLKLYLGNYNDLAIKLNPRLTKTTQLFLIAQEVQKIKPDAVGELNGYLAVDYAKAVKE